MTDRTKDRINYTLFAIVSLVATYVVLRGGLRWAEQVSTEGSFLIGLVASFPLCAGCAVFLIYFFAAYGAFTNSKNYCPRCANHMRPTVALLQAGLTEFCPECYKDIGLPKVEEVELAMDVRKE